VSTFGKRISRIGSPPATERPQVTAGEGYALNQDGEEGSLLWATLMTSLAMAVIFVIVGGAIYLGSSWLLGADIDLPEKASYVSSVDRKCGAGWTKDLPNGKQLKCYLTVSTKRLCSPLERQHLVAVINRYSEDASVWEREFLAASLRMISEVQSQGMQLGHSAGQLQKEQAKAVPDEKRMRELAEEVGALSSGITSGPDAVRQRAKDFVVESILVQHLQSLLAKGYLSREDFGWWGNRLVDKAVSKLETSNTPIQQHCL
jgi:hypothetical protein